MPLPWRTGQNPLLEQLFLLRLEHLMRLGRRHHVVGISCGDARPHFALLKAARHDGWFMLRRALENALLRVEPQSGLAGTVVRAVAGETIFLKEKATLRAHTG